MTGRSLTRIFLVSTLYGAATLAAALDSDAFAPADRRLLLVCNNATTPETAPAVDTMPGFDRLRGRFDRVLSWNETISPFHPGGWSPRPDDVPLWERYLRLLWGLGDDRVELVVESIQVNPALAVSQLFPDAPIDVYADGLMSYGPTRNKLDPLVGTRIGRLLHLDLVPGLTPLLLTEFGVKAHTVPTAAFTKVLTELGQASGELDVPEGGALLLGQYLSALGILTPQEEEDLHVRMVRGAVTRGHREVVFKPHPSAPARWSRLLEREAEKLDVTLTVLEQPVLAEVLYERMRPALVVGCFSTALLTASAFYGLPTARTGTGLLLERLTPYQNSNRMPVTIVDALVPDIGDADGGARRAAAPPTGLVQAVGYAMQHQIHPGLRPAAERYLTAHLDQYTWRYFKRRRLTALGLPGAIPSQLSFLPRNAAVRRVARRARAVQRRLKKRAAFG
ncbi:alpha-2,8-polysialyltransferase family protein [Streptomyces pinistramenti]|uniref:alpha-2,8-polysialyltransferase family protein n=1 Tax=Streptomyces pinistramenti TaxID=2884812 RepID=UPI001D082C09|nr:alpha-2,8-polysialyltransferase family protein [Streptomyces pinistramenti]MCB5909567.1 alpha-2,8-polysialyltransferase family protein [Streptomyces pinistramenti]